MRDCIIIGAGMAGLTAAEVLQESGKEVLILEKSRGFGGRMATRRIAGAVADTGAQFISVRSPEFQSAMAKWQSDQVAKVWAHGFPMDDQPAQDGHPRFIGSEGMTSISKLRADKLNIQLNWKVASLLSDQEGWTVVSEEGEIERASSLILTPPGAQSLALVSTLKLNESEQMKQLRSIEYHRCICVVAKMVEPTKIPTPGGISFSAGIISWLADNQQKGISAEPSITIHAAPEYSAQHYHDSDDEIVEELMAAATSYLESSSYSEAQVRRWMYSLPKTTTTDPFLVLNTNPPLICAGEAMVGGKVEGAFTSGRLAGEWLVQNT